VLTVKMLSCHQLQSYMEEMVLSCGMNDGREVLLIG